MVPRRRLELPRVAPQIPETCASTNSATWAGGRKPAHSRQARLKVNPDFGLFPSIYDPWRKMRFDCQITIDIRILNRVFGCAVLLGVNK
jgi:hypothetical protein